MKAVVYTQYGPPDVLKLGEVAKPTPKDHDILIRTRTTSVNYGDLAARDFANMPPQEFNMPFLLWLVARMDFGLSKPRRSILGSEFAGEVEAVGKAVTQFKSGDPVFGYLGQRMGAYAEYVCMPEDGCVALKPSTMSFEEAAAVPYGAIMALGLLRKAPVQPGQKVLIYGASGSIGAAAVQLAKHFGAEVTGVCATPRVELVKSLGADKVLDYTKENFANDTETYDLIFDVLGKASFARSRKALKPNGIHLYASFKLEQLLQMLWTSRSGGKKVICAFAPGSKKDLLCIKELIEAGKIKAIVDQSYELERIAEAHRYVEAGRKKGSIIIRV